MVFMRMGADYHVKMADPHIFQGGHETGRSRIRAGIDQHRAIAALNCGRIRLADIQESDLKSRLGDAEPVLGPEKSGSLPLPVPSPEPE